MPLLWDKKQMGKPKTTDKERFPELFAVNHRIDRRQCTRVVPMRVLVLGMCRTGTYSMWEALKMLGFVDCYHMMSTLYDPNDNDMWMEAINGKFFGGEPFTTRDWDQLLGHCQAICDFPACAFGPELIQAYPDAKVILTNRDVDSWHRSCRATISGSMTSGVLRVLGYFDTEVMGKWSPMTRRLFKAVFDDDFENNGKAAFQKQYEEVRRIVPKDRLLEMEIGEGWDRLCDFLDVPVPKHPYPHSNEATVFKDRKSIRVKLSFYRGLPNMIKTLVVIFAVFTWLYLALFYS